MGLIASPSLLLLINVISTIASLTTIPARATKPNIETILNGFPEISSPRLLQLMQMEQLLKLSTAECKN